MANILSQDEVDALLGAIPTDDEEAEERQQEVSEASDKKISSYDFRRPSRVSREQLKILQNLHVPFSRRLGVLLSTLLRARVTAELMSLEQFSYGEYIISLPQSAGVFLLDLKEENGTTILDMQSALGLAMFDKLLGGSGLSPEEERDMTPIEATIISKMVGKILPALKEVWAPICALEPVMRPFELNPQLQNLLPPTETVLVLTLQVSMPKTSGLITLTYPFPFIETILGHLAGENRFLVSRDPLSEETKKEIKHALGMGPMDIAVQLGRSDVTVYDFLKLKVGDVLPLDAKVEDPVNIIVDGYTKFLGRPGRTKKWKAVQILGVYDGTQTTVSEGEARHG
ncbi:MAG: flagellar motor switch protein FliM [Candidatus Eisenbacteria bacterium]|uniref:Flagellar motor switch protein FliM n=1 Tax=Eiseniibacteriota bacterium TaxID=2212470 RepID=A0A948RWJ8_UNCEI|nr:flagellar motor switch protein FliM [Candidatus Eisenbacteria bacterium]MBU1950952.1 flagellar motor switch protein FliM [Candidatus Eisenbacteria bacterium]MBU2692175.1 flagellar motor switch protein FliM [Candidatus Eisenbacteria bacterium]